MWMLVSGIEIGAMAILIVLLIAERPKRKYHYKVSMKFGWVFSFASKKRKSFKGGMTVRLSESCWLAFPCQMIERVEEKKADGAR